MKTQNLYLILLLSISTSIFAQKLTIEKASPFTACSGTFVDSGGVAGNYGANENLVFTICPSTAGQALQLDFTSFQTDSEDYMVIYDGNTVDYDTVMGTYNGYNLTMPFTVTATTDNISGCLTITFISNNNAFESVGWLANISCVAPVSPAVCQGSGSGVSTAGCVAVVSGGLGMGNVDVTPISCVAASTCTDIEAAFLDLGDTSDYRVESIPYVPPYQFDCLKVPVSVGTDDVWSPPVNLPFDFCFYGNTYNQCIIGSNGAISFDLANNTPGGPAGYLYSNSLPSTTGALFANTIYGVYHDIDPSKGGEVGYELITLNTGCRALVVGWHDVPMFSDNSLLYTGMMVLYENTNIIEVYIEEKNIDGIWNDGNAIVGVQNVGATQSIVSPGRNGLDADWTVTNEAWRFVPDGASITDLAWYEGPTATGPVLGTIATLNVCPITTTTYTAEVTYTLCDGSVITDTESTTVAIESCATDIDFDGNNDFIDTASFMGGYGAATQMSWVYLDTNFGVPVAINGNGNTATGGLNGTNAIGVINAVTTAADAVGVSARLTGTNTTMVLTLDHTVPIGTNITISLSRDTNPGEVVISDGNSVNDLTWGAGTIDGLSHITFTTSVATNNLIFTRTSGAMWIDGVDYSYLSGGDGMVMGQPNNKLWINTTGSLSGSVVTNFGAFTVTTTTTIPNDIWAHVTSIYDGANLKLYINGVEEASIATGGTNLDIDTYRYAIGRDAENDDKFFNGFIQESRVYDLALTESQLREQIYQPIQNNGGNVSGVTIPKDIDNGSLSWSALVLYLEMNTVVAGVTIDTSNSGVLATVYNVVTVQNKTAPIPYVANTSGIWTTTGTWEHGNVWDIENLPNKDWAIVQVTNNSKVTTTASHTHIGLLVDTGSELEIQNDQLLQNTSYIKLDGQIDLVGESQLIQTINSDLDVLSAGYLERDQQGHSNIYNYNFWSSPVNPVNISGNNTDYSIAAILKDGTIAGAPQNIIFQTSGYDGSVGASVTLADYWMYKYVNQPDLYGNWANGHVRSTGVIKVGEGYTQKGSGAATATQNYVFTGKPNNGTIQHTIGANNVYLVGNPYASALDADQFINDNLASVENTGDVIQTGASTGALYFWEHFSTNNSHVFAAYEGGYATYNLAGGVIAVPDVDVSANGIGSIRPGRYIPVAQGFFVQGSPTGGTIEFNNGQRAYKRESVAADDSVFTKTTAEDDSNNTNISSEISRVYFKFTTPEGPQRELLLATKEGLEDGMNYGYDARLLNTQPTDCSWLLKTDIDEKLVIQGIGAIYEDLELPLHIKVGADGICKFEVASLSGIDQSLEVYFIDKELNTTTRLEENIPVIFELISGIYADRFSVIFKTVEVLTIEDIEVTSDEIVVFYNSDMQSIIINNPTTFSAKNISLYTVLGQQIVKVAKNYTNVKEVIIPVNVSAGTYLIVFDYNNGIQVTKKLILK